MAGSVNKVILIGNLGRDPEVKSFANGGKVVNLNIATSETWRDKATGERKERVEWHRVSILNEGLAGIAEQYLRKGSTVYIEGQLETRKWTDQQGVEKYTTEVVLRPYRGELTLLGGRQDGGGDRQQGSAGGDDHRPMQRDAGGSGRPADARDQYTTRGAAGGGHAGGGGGVIDDEIPFAPEWR